MKEKKTMIRLSIPVPTPIWGAAQRNRGCGLCGRKIAPASGDQGKESSKKQWEFPATPSKKKPVMPAVF